MRGHLIIYTLTLLFTGIVQLKAQDNEVMLGLRTGHSNLSGGFAAVSAEARGIISEKFIIHGGAQYNTIGKVAVEARPSYFHDFDWGRVSAELLLSYTNFASINSFAAGAGAGISSNWIYARLGYYCHVYGGRGGQITEPFNIFYEFGVSILPMIEKWDLKLLVTNNEIFELDRHYQPTFSAVCSYFPRHDLGIKMGIGCKPSGMFHLSADYYESYLKVGICYRW